MSLQKIAVLGLGKVGTLAAKLLHENGFDVTGIDGRPPQEPLPFAVRRADLEADAGIVASTSGFDAVLSCLPYRLNLRMPPRRTRSASTTSISPKTWRRHGRSSTSARRRAD